MSGHGHDAAADERSTILSAAFHVQSPHIKGTDCIAKHQA